MGLFAALSRLDKNFAWSFLGFLLAIVFGGISLYTEFYKNDAPVVEFELLSNAPVLDVREKLPELEVLYKQQDISKSGQTLSVVLIRVVNVGSGDLLASHYDSKAPLGITIRGATLVKAEVANTSNGYLSSVAQVHMPAPLDVSFEPVILEPNEWFLVKLLLLHRADVAPTVSSKGKIAGMRAVPTVSAATPQGAAGFWSNAFSGGIWTQIIRLIGYFLGLIVFALAIVLPVLGITNGIQKIRRRRLVEKFRKTTKQSLSTLDDLVFLNYVEKGPLYLAALVDFVAGREEVHSAVSRFQERKTRRSRDRYTDVDLTLSAGHVIYDRDDAMSPNIIYFEHPYFDIQEMIDRGFISQINDQWVVTADRVATVTAFTEFLRLMGAMPKSN